MKPECFTISIPQASLDDLRVRPVASFESAGPEGGPFEPTAMTFGITNTDCSVGSSLESFVVRTVFFGFLSHQTNIRN